MDPGQIMDRLRRLPNAQSAFLKDYCMRFNKVDDKIAGAGKANIIHSHGEIVFGVLYNVTEEEMKKLDYKEGVYTGHYRRESIEVAIESNNNNNVRAITYIACQGMIKEGLKPTEEYLDHLLAGRKYLPVEYIKKLERTPMLERNPDEKISCE